MRSALGAVRSSILAAAVLAGTVVGPGVPEPAAASNAFCAASVAWSAIHAATNPVAPGSAATRYALALGVRGTTSAAASVTFIGTKNAYIVQIPVTPLVVVMKKRDRFTRVIVVHFPHATRIRYAYVDTAAVDGAPPVTCPTVAERPGVPKFWHWKQLLAGKWLNLDATLQQALPPLRCGAVYRQARMARAGTVYGGNFGFQARSAEVLVDVDSSGKPALVKLVRSSGIPGFDRNVLASAEASRFHPARFLCSPVVSEYLFVGQYSP